MTPASASKRRRVALSFIRRHRLSLAVSTVLAGLALNVLVQDGVKPFLIVVAAGVGYVLVLGSVGWLTGAQVVRHSRREAAAIQAGKHSAKELTQ
jgi:hypothetical protein